MEPEIVRGLLALLLGGLLVAAGVEDVRTREIADRKSIAIVLAAPLWWWANGASLWPGAAVQLGQAAAAFAIFAAAFHFGMMGGGDVKLIAALALWLPFDVFATMLVVMSLAGGAVTLAMLAQRRWRGGEIEVPYGVAIAMAGLLVLREPILNQFG